MVAKPGSAETENEGLAMRTLLIGVFDIDQQRDGHDHQKRQRQGCPQRPIAALAKLQVDEVADHHLLAAAQHPRRDIGPQRGHKHQDRSRDDPRFYNRQDNAAQHLQAAGVKIIARLQQAHVKAVDGCKQRQHHQRQIDIGHADKHCRIGIHHLDRAADRAQFHQHGVHQPFGAQHLVHRIGADQQIGPKRDGDQKQPQRPRLGRAGGDEPSGGKAHRKGGQRGQHRQF